MPQLSLADQHALKTAASRLWHLRELDTVWTNHLETAEPPLPAEDVSTLRQIGGEMGGILDEAAGHAQRVSDVASQHPDVLSAGYEQLLQSASVPQEHKAYLQGIVQQRGNGQLPTAVQNAAAAVRQGAPAERQQLAGKLDVIGAGRFSRGDLTKEFTCNFLLVCIGAGMAAWEVTGLLISAAALAAAYLIGC